MRCIFCFLLLSYSLIANPATTENEPSAYVEGVVGGGKVIRLIFS